MNDRLMKSKSVQQMAVLSLLVRCCPSISAEGSICFWLILAKKDRRSVTQKMDCAMCRDHSPRGLDCLTLSLPSSLRSLACSADRLRRPFRRPLPSKLPLQFYPQPTARHPHGDFAATQRFRSFVHTSLASCLSSVVIVSVPAPPNPGARWSVGASDPVFFRCP